MARNTLKVFALVPAVALIGAPVLAHHSISAEFDLNKPIHFTAEVVMVDWMNPHIYTHVEVTAGPLSGQTLKVEGGPPNSLFRAGWRKDSLKPGAIVIVDGLRAKNPESLNVVDAEMTLEDGSPVFARFGRVN